VGLLYLACLLAGGGVIVAQLALGHDSGGGHDVHHGAGDHDLTAWSLLASVRFWSFALLAFGLVGTLLTFLGLAGTVVTLVLGVLSGVGSGFTAAVVLHRLLSRSPQTGGSYADLRGQVGRVVVPVTPTGPGKVRVSVNGLSVDVVARAAEAFDVGEAILVLEVSGDGEALVVRAPKELRA
jgi:hypothetical protein